MKFTRKISVYRCMVISRNGRYSTPAMGTDNADFKIFCYLGSPKENRLFRSNLRKKTVCIFDWIVVHKTIAGWSGVSKRPPGFVERNGYLLEKVDEIL